MSRRGFTLVEMLVATSLLAVVLAVAMSALVGVNGSAERVRRIGDAQETARLGMQQLAYDLRMAGLGASNGQIGIAVGAGAARRVPVIYSGPNVTVTEPGGQTIVTNSIPSAIHDVIEVISDDNSMGRIA